MCKLSAKIGNIKFVQKTDCLISVSNYVIFACMMNFTGNATFKRQTLGLCRSYKAVDEFFIFYIGAK